MTVTVVPGGNYVAVGAGSSKVIATARLGPPGPPGEPGEPGEPGPPGADALWQRMTLAEFNALPVKDPNTLYVIIG